MVAVILPAGAPRRLLNISKELQERKEVSEGLRRSYRLSKQEVVVFVCVCVWFYIILAKQACK